MSGLKHKYNITKVGGRPVDPNAIYFVLKLNSKDPVHARACRSAAIAYANAVEGDGQLHEVGEDLRGLVALLDLHPDADAVVLQLDGTDGLKAVMRRGNAT